VPPSLGVKRRAGETVSCLLVVLVKKNLDDGLNIKVSRRPAQKKEGGFVWLGQLRNTKKRKEE